MDDDLTMVSWWHLPICWFITIKWVNNKVYLWCEAHPLDWWWEGKHAWYHSFAVHERCWNTGRGIITRYLRCEAHPLDWWWGGKHAWYHSFAVHERCCPLYTKSQLLLSQKLNTMSYFSKLKTTRYVMLLFVLYIFLSNFFYTSHKKTANIEGEKIGTKCVTKLGLFPLSSLIVVLSRMISPRQAKYSAWKKEVTCCIL